VNEDTVGVNPALVALAGTTSVAGAVTAALLLVKFTLRPSPSAATVSVTVQLSLPDPVMDPLRQESALNAAGTAASVPVGLIAAVPQLDSATREYANIVKRAQTVESTDRTAPAGAI
jgi:hypothetical protein